MKKVRLAKSDVEVSTLCMGTDLIGSRIDRETSFQLFDLFRERGGTFIDTGNFYAAWLPGCQGGESETTIGAWMKERRARNQVAIATKLGFDYPGCAGGLSAEQIRRRPGGVHGKEARLIRVDEIHCDAGSVGLELLLLVFRKLIPLVHDGDLALRRRLGGHGRGRGNCGVGGGRRGRGSRCRGGGRGWGAGGEQ